MCRRDQLLSLCLAAFGLGLLTGCCFESGLLSVCIGVGLILGGICLLNRR